MDPIIDHFDGFKLNDGIRIDRDDRDPEAGGASHVYDFVMDDGSDFGLNIGSLQYQHGPRHAEGSVPGLTCEAVIASLLDRLRGFQDGPYRCRENACALTHLEEALFWLQRRAKLRAAQAVLGKNAEHQEPK